MPRTRRKSQKATQSPYDAMCALARHIVSAGHPSYEPNYWDMKTESLLIRLLPRGIEAALERIRIFRSAPDEYPDELDFLLSAGPVIVASVLAQAEGDLVAHIERTKWWPPNR